MQRDNWPVEQEGIRPAGPPDRCLYCGQPKGHKHLFDCVIREKTVIIDVTIRICETMPESWTVEDIEHHWNSGSWCADNILQVLENQAEKRGCLCEDFTAKFVRDATEKDEEDYKVFVKDSKS